MKRLLTTFAIICSLTTFGQTPQEYIESGLLKTDKQDFKGAIKEFDKALKSDNLNKEAYYYRGNCELNLGDFKSA